MCKHVKMKHSTRHNVLQLPNVLVYLRHKYLLYDKSLTCEELGNKERNIFSCNAAKVCNNASIQELGRYLCSENETFRELTFAYSEFIMNKGAMLDKYNNIKKLLIKY